MYKAAGTVMHLSMFSPRGGRVGLPQRIKTILKNWGLIPYSCDTILCQKSPGPVFKFRHNFFQVFSLKQVSSCPCAKFLFQIPESSECFGSLIPRVSPPSCPPTVGKHWMVHNDPKFLDRLVWANSADPDQTVWSGSTLFFILSASFGFITLW